MVVVPSGSFMMGSKSRFDDEMPSHRVTISRPFAVGKYEVTFAEWDACIAGGGCGGYRPKDGGWGRDDRPVINVNWNDVQSYVKWLSRKTGSRYRLLSEAEWEYVARAGSTTVYPWGSQASRDHANYGHDDCCVGHSEGADRWVNTSPVGSFEGNPFGLHDLLGNVWEWVEDCWHGSYVGAPENGSAWTTGGDCRSRIMRGGAWQSFPRFLRSALRQKIGLGIGSRSSKYGFRIARTPSP